MQGVSSRRLGMGQASEGLDFNNPLHDTQRQVLLVGEESNSGKECRHRKAKEPGNQDGPGSYEGILQLVRSQQ